jgi:O-antigen/teichoic acid export membrane protein
MSAQVVRNPHYCYWLGNCSSGFLRSYPLTTSPMNETVIAVPRTNLPGQVEDRLEKRPRAWFAFLPRASGARLLRGVLWNTVGGAAAQGGSFLTSILLARIFGRHVYGQFAWIQNSAVVLAGVAALGLGVTASKYVSKERVRHPARVGRILGLSSLVAITAALCFSVALIVLAPSLAVGREATGLLTLGLRLSAVYVFFLILNGYQAGALAGFEAFPSIARISVLYAFTNLLLSGILALRLGLGGTVLAQGASALLLWVLCQRALRAQCRAASISISYRGAWRERFVLMHFSMPAAASGVLASVAMWWCNATLVRVDGYSELALFSVVNNLRAMVLFLPALIIRVAAPLLNSLLASGDWAGYHRTFWGTVAVNGSIALFLATILSLAGQHVLRLFGKEFAGSSAVILLLLGSVVVEVVATSLYQAIFSGGRLWRHFAIMSIWTVVLLTGSHLTSPYYGAAGLAFSYLVAWCVALALYAWIAPRRENAESPESVL